MQNSHRLAGFLGEECGERLCQIEEHPLTPDFRTFRHGHRDAPVSHVKPVAQRPTVLTSRETPCDGSNTSQRPDYVLVVQRSNSYLSYRNLKCKSQSQISLGMRAGNRRSVEVQSNECWSPTYRHSTKTCRTRSLKYTGECRPGLNKAPSYWASCVKQFRFLSYHIPPTNRSSIRRYSLTYWRCPYNKPHIGTRLLKTTVHWYVTPCILVIYTDVSEKPSVTIIRVEHSWRQQAPFKRWNV